MKKEYKRGYIKFFRKFVDWEYYSDPIVKSVFLHFILNAEIEETRICGEVLQRGQTLFTVRTLAKELGISERSLRTAISKLKSSGEIIVENNPNTKKSRATVVKFDVYQTSRKKSDTVFDTVTDTVTDTVATQYKTAKQRNFSSDANSEATQLPTRSSTQLPTFLPYIYKEYIKKNKEEERNTRARMEEKYPPALVELYIAKAEGYGFTGEQAIAKAAQWIMEDDITGKLPRKEETNEKEKSYEIDDFFQAALHKRKDNI